MVFGEFVLPKELLKLRRSFAITTCSVFESWKIVGNLQEVRLYLRTTRSNERHNKRCGNLPPVANFPRRTGFLWACLLLVAVGAEHRAFQWCLNMDNHVSSQWQSHCNHLQSGCKSGSSVTPALRAFGKRLARTLCPSAALRTLETQAKCETSASCSDDSVPIMSSFCFFAKAPGLYSLPAAKAYSEKHAEADLTGEL